MQDLWKIPCDVCIRTKAPNTRYSKEPKSKWEIQTEATHGLKHESAWYARSNGKTTEPGQKLSMVVCTVVQVTHEKNGVTGRM